MAQRQRIKPESKQKAGRPPISSSSVAAQAENKNVEALALVGQVAKAIKDRRVELDQIADLFFDHPDADARVASLQSLIFSISFKHNEGAVTHSWLATKLFCHEYWPFWPDDADRTAASRSTIDNFAYGRYRPSKRDTVLSYILAVYLLHEVGHPCFQNYLASTLLISNGAVDAFAKIVVPDVVELEERKNSKLLAIVLRARALLQHLEIDPEEYSDEICSLLKMPFFADRLSPCRVDNDLDGFKVGAVRVGPHYEHGDLVGSNVAFSLVVNYDSRSGLLEQYLYVSTSVSAERGGYRVVSDGIVLVRNNEVIVFQHKLDGSGLNIATIPRSEIAHNEGLVRGVILTVDTIGGTGSLCSRICLFTKDKDVTIPMRLTEDRLYYAFKDQSFYQEHLTRDVISSLRRIGRVDVLDPLGRQHTISTWGAVRTVLSRRGVRSKIDNQGIKGYQIGPLRAL